MKKTVIIALAFLALLFMGRQILVPKIAEGGFERLVSDRIGADPAANLQDGLHVYICGAGSPLFDPKRSGPCIAVIAGDQAFVFDAGASGSQNLGPMGFPLPRVQAIFLTHLHSDHIDGLGQILLGSWVNSPRAEPTKVYGPAGTAQVVSGFNRAYQIDSAYRTAHHGPDIANPASFGARAQEIAFTGLSETVYEKGRVKITAYQVSHAPVSGALGYRIDYKGRSISISGDTAFDPNIAAASEGVDVLFHEALNMEMVKTMEAAAKANGAKGLEKILFDIRDYHTSPVDAAKTAQMANARALVLYHIVPMLPSDLLLPVFTKGMDAEFDGKITVSKDGTVLHLPAGGDRILYEDLSANF
jgi:ribonuclease Z